MVAALRVVRVFRGAGLLHPGSGDHARLCGHARVAAGAGPVLRVVWLFGRIQFDAPDVGADARGFHALGAERDPLQVRSERGLGDILASGRGDLLAGYTLMVRVIVLGCGVLADVAVLAGAPQFGLVLHSRGNVALQRDLVAHVHPIDPQGFGGGRVHVDHVERLILVVAAVPDDVAVRVSFIRTGARRGGGYGDPDAIVVFGRIPVGRDGRGRGFHVLIVVERIVTRIRVGRIGFLAGAETVQPGQFRRIIRFDHRALVLAVLAPDFELHGRPGRGLRRVADPILVVVRLVSGLMEHVVHLERAVCVLAVRVAQPFLRHGGRILLDRGPLIRLVAALMVGVPFTVDVGVQHRAVRRFQRGLPVDHARLVGLELRVGDLQG